MYKIALLNKTKTYMESPQKNPMRWTILYKEGEEFTSQTGPFKCRDFFNDVVAFKHSNKSFEVYRFNNNIKFNDEGLYVHIDKVGDFVTFFNNLDVINAKLQEQGFEPLLYTDQDKDTAVLLFPHSVWQNTYCISVLTAAIRASNYGMVFNTFDDIFAPNSPLVKIENLLNPKQCESVVANGFKVPEDLQKYWFYSGKDYNSEKTPNIDSYTIHNCGMVQWMHYMGVM